MEAGGESSLLSGLRLQYPSISLFPSHLESVNEMKALGENLWDLLPKEGENPEQFVERKLRNELSPSEGMVPSSTFWATTKDNVVVGGIDLRHSLNDKLNEFGGHIGYEVRPSFRRRGVAKTMLKLVLQTPKAQAIGNLLLTCSPLNEGSRKTIEANGGVLAGIKYVERVNRDTCYYWINLNPSLSQQDIKLSV